MILTIARRELQSLFLSPLAWSVLAIIEFLLALVFIASIDQFTLIQPRLVAVDGAGGVTDYIIEPVLNTAAVICLLVAPLLTMRMISEERRNGTLPLLLSAPASMTEIVLGKYLGLLGFFALLVLLIAAMPLTLLAGTNLDLGKVAAGLLGLFLLLGAFAAIGLYMSSLTRYPAVAAVSTFGILLMLWLLKIAGDFVSHATTDANPELTDALVSVINYLWMLDHYQSLVSGVFNTTDVIYYLLLTVTFLTLSVRQLDPLITIHKQTCLLF